LLMGVLGKIVKMKPMINPKFFLFTLLICKSLLTYSQEEIGVASAVNKNATDITLEEERKLINAGYKIIQNHTIETDEIGKAQMMLLDGTSFSVGPNSSVMLDSFIYNPETAEGSLEVTAKGLMRLVGGKVTKKKPAVIRTNSATVGIRGGIGVIITDGPKTDAIFLYGDEMTVTPSCVQSGTCPGVSSVSVTEAGYSIQVESPESEPSEPQKVTSETLDSIQSSLEGNDDSSESDEETSSDESESSEEQQDEDSETTEEEESSDQQSETANDASTESTEEDSDAVEVDEGMLDSSGVSENSSSASPESLSSTDTYNSGSNSGSSSDSSGGGESNDDSSASSDATSDVAPVFDAGSEI